MSKKEISTHEKPTRQPKASPRSLADDGIELTEKELARVTGSLTGTGKTVKIQFL